MDRAPDDLIEFYVNKPTDDSLGEINKNIIAGFVSQNIFGAPWSNGHEQAILPFVTTPTSQCLGAFQGEEGYTFLSCWDWLQGWWIPQNQDLEIVGLIFREPVFISQMETIWTKDTSDTPKTDFSKGVITWNLTSEYFHSFLSEFQSVECHVKNKNRVKLECRVSEKIKIFVKVK